MPTVEEMNLAGFLVDKQAGTTRRSNAKPIDVRRASKAGGQADIHPDGAGKVAKLERHPRHGAVGEVQVQKGVSRRILIRVTAIRTRLIDEDNLCEKYHVDLLRYASGGALGDSPATTHIEVAQQKAGKNEREEVRIEVYEL
jgi:hypothetical protein